MPLTVRACVKTLVGNQGGKHLSDFSRGAETW